MPFSRKPAPLKCSMKDCKATLNTNTILYFPINEKHRKKWVKIISYSNPEFAQLKYSEIMKLGICDDHFMVDQFDEDGRRNKNAYPNLITQEEVSLGVPIISYDSDSEDDERKNPKNKYLSIQQQSVVQQSVVQQSVVQQSVLQQPVVQKSVPQESVPQQPILQPSILPKKGRPKKEFKDICRLCLAIDVKMFSLTLEPIKQYYQFIEPCIDELETVSNNNLPSTVCFVCANSLKKCYEFGKMCAQSQCMLMECYLVHSKINSEVIKDFDRSKLPHIHNLNRHSLPSFHTKKSKFKINLKSKEIQTSHKIDEDVAKKNYNRILNFRFKSPLRNNVEAAKIKTDATKTKIKAAPNEIYASKSKILATPIEIDATKTDTVKIVNTSFINLPASDPKDSEALSVPKEVEIDWDINNECQSDEFVSADCTQKVLIEDDQMSIQSFEQDVLVEDEVDLGVKTKVNKSLLDTNNTESSVNEVTTEVPVRNTIGPLSHRKFECKHFALFGSLSFEDVVDSEQTNAATENLDLPTVLEQSNDLTRVPEPETLPSSSTEAQAVVNDNVAAADDPLFVNVANVNKDTAKDTPSLSESQINILKKSVLKTHGEVEIMSMFYQGDDINVIMVNAQGKRVQLKLSKTDNLQPVADKPTLPRQPEPTLTYENRCWTVRMLSKEQQYAQVQRRQQSQNYLKAQLKCNICFEVFQKPTNYTAHAAKHNPSSGQYCCLVCKQYFYAIKHLKKHQRTHSKIYICKMCPVYFYSTVDAREHQKAHVYYQCPVCNKEFRFLHDFQGHKNAHSKRWSSRNGIMYRPDLKPMVRYTMDRQKTTIGTNTTIKTATPIPEVKKWSASCCGIIFAHEKVYRKHLRTRHPRPKNPLSENGSMCDICGLILQTKQGLRRHLAIHTYRKCNSFKCQQCKKVFRTLGILERHQQQIHRIVTERPCPKCPKDNNTDRQRHLSKCKECDRRRQRHPCEFCGFLFRNNYNLKRHILSVHSGAKYRKES